MSTTKTQRASADEGVEAGELPTEEEVPDSSADDVFVLPSTIAQRRFWLLDQMDPENPAYNAPIALRFTGALDVGALERALDEIVRRHEVLRTTFELEDGELMQVVADHAALRLTTVDAREVPAPQREAWADRFAVEEARRPFDLAKGPLIRACLVTVGDAESLLFVTMHHIVCDGWSLGLIVAEIAALYGAFAEGRPSPLPELPIQYADFAHWQRDWLAGADFEKQLEYWKGQLTSNLPVLDLSTDRPRKRGRPGPGAMRSLLLPERVGKALKAMCQREDVTMFMLFFAVFTVLLRRHTDQESVVVGSPSANRNQAETEGLIGLFVNLLVFRTDLSGNPRFRDFLARVRDTTLEAFANHDMPFEKLVDELKLERDRGTSSLIQVMFIYQTAFMRPAEAAGVAIKPERSVSPGAAFEMTQSVVERAEGLRLQLEYNTDLFDDATAERLLGQFSTLLEAVVADPNARISDLALLTEPELARLRANGKPDGEAIAARAHDVVAAHAARTPDAVAATAGGRTLTYGELDRRAARFASRLRAAGVRRGALVAIVMRPSLDVLVGVLGVLKAGGAVVPVAADGSGSMLAEWEVGFLVTDRAGERAPSGWSGSIVSLDAATNDDSADGAEDIEDERTLDDVAFVLRTSGTSGRPRGVIVTHHALSRHAADLARAYDLGPNDRLGRLGPAGDCALAEELFSVWTAGASLALAPEGMRGGDLLQWADEAQPTVLSLPTSVWYRIVDELAIGQQSLASSVRLVAAGGERVTTALYRAWSRYVGESTRFFVAYRTAETVGTAALFETSPSDVETATSHAMVGRPVGGLNVFVLDVYLQPVPVGSSGELYVAGDTLVDQYVCDAARAEADFVSSDALGERGMRLFRTGDLGRYHADGAIELLGRVADKARIQGYRTELRAIDLAVERHAAVRMAETVLHEDAEGERRLVAYVVPEPGRTLVVSELQHMVRASLPASAVPAAFVQLDALPIAATGKVDRDALVAIDSFDSALEREVLGPRDDVERALVAMWSRLLGVDDVGVRDSFFELGGHSLLAAQLFHQIEQEFGRSLPLALLFQRATIEHLAERLREEAGADAWSPLVPLQTNGTKPPFYVGGSNPRYADLPGYFGTDQPLYGLDVYALEERRLKEGKRLYTTVEEMAECFVREIRVLQPTGPYYIGGGCEGGIVASEVARQLQAAGDEVALFVLWETRRPGYTRRDPFAALRSVENPVRFLFGYGMKKLQSGTASALRLATHSDPAEADQAKRNLLLRKAIFGATSSYEPQRIHGRMEFIEAAEQRRGFKDPSEGWEELTTEGLERHVLPGDHTTYFDAHFISFAECLRGILKRAQAKRQVTEIEEP